MRTREELKERLRLAIVENLNQQLEILMREPENVLPGFIEKLVNELQEIVLDEIVYGKRR